MVAQPIPGLEGLEPDWSQAASAAVDLRTWAKRAAKQRGVPEDVLIGVLTHESGLDPKAYGNGGGVGQFIESTARGYGTTQAELRANPHKAVDLAAQLLRDNADMFGGDYDKAAAAYFIGGGNVSQAERTGGANWLMVADGLARKYQQGSVSSYLSKVHGGAPTGSAAARSTVSALNDYAFPVEGYKGKVDLHWGSDKGGADLFAEPGTPVKAMRGGTVTSVGTGGLGGNNVTIHGTDGKDYYYAHGDRAPEVKQGQTIPTGQYLFGVGDSGNAAGKGAHLHIGIGNGIVSGSGATGGSGRDFDATALLSSVLSGSPVVETPTGSAAAGSAVRSMLGDQTVTSQPRQNVFEMLADARETRETQLQAMTQVEPLADVTGLGGEPGGIEPLAEVEGLGASAARASLAPPEFAMPELAPAPQPLDMGPPPLPAALEPPPLPPQSIRPPNVGEAGLAMLPGATPIDQAPPPPEAPSGWGRLAAFGLAEPPPPAPPDPTGQELGAGFGRVFAPEPPDENPDAIGGFFGRTLSAPSILEPGQGGEQYTEGGEQYVDPGARATLRGELQARRRGQSQYGAIPEAIAEKPLEVGAVAAMGLLPSVLGAGPALTPQLAAAGVEAPLVAGGLADVAGTGLARLAPQLGRAPLVGRGLEAAARVAPGLSRNLATGAVSGQYLHEALTAIPGYEGLPEWAQMIIESAPYSVPGKQRLATKFLETIGGGLGQYEAGKLDEALGTGGMPIIGGPAGLAGGILAGGAPAVLERPMQNAWRRAAVNLATNERFAANAPGFIAGRERAGADWAQREAGQAPPARTGLAQLGAIRGAAEPTVPEARRFGAEMGQEGLLGEGPQEQRYGAKVRSQYEARFGPDQAAKQESGFPRSGLTWATYGDNLAVFEPDVPSWQREPSEPGVTAFRGDPRNPADLAAAMREAVQGVRDERAGVDTRGQMQRARAMLGGEQNPVQPEDIAFGEQPGNEAERAGMRYVEPGRAPTPDAVALERDRGLFEGMATSQLEVQHGRLADAAESRRTPQERQHAAELRDLVGNILERRASAEGGPPRVAGASEPSPQEARKFGAEMGQQGLVPRGPRGAPEGVVTPEDVAALDARLTEAARAGEAGRFWYREVGSGLLRMAHGDRATAVRAAVIAALGSPKTQVKSQGQMILNALGQYQRGEPIRTSTASNDARINRALSGTDAELDDFIVQLLEPPVTKGQRLTGEALERGRKTGNFLLAMIDEIDPERGAALRERAPRAGVTVDMHVARQFFGRYTGITDARYSFMEDSIKRIADGLGWTPAEAQAALFTTDIADDIKRGFTTPEQAAFNYIDAINQRGKAGHVTWESAPGKATWASEQLPGYENWSLAQQTAFHNDVKGVFLDDQGNNRLMAALGMLGSGRRDQPGLYEGGLHLGVAEDIYLTESMYDRASQFAALTGLVTQQTAVPWTRPVYDTRVGAHNGFVLDTGRLMTPDELLALGSNLGDEYAVMTGSGSQVIVFKIPGELDFTGRALKSGDAGFKAMAKANKEARQFILDTADEVWDNDVEYVETSMSTDGDYLENDWSVEPYGEAYSRAAPEARQPAVRAVLDEARAKYKAVVERYAADHATDPAIGERDTRLNYDNLAPVSGLKARQRELGIGRGDAWIDPQGQLWKRTKSSPGALEHLDDVSIGGVPGRELGREGAFGPVMNDGWARIVVGKDDTTPGTERRIQVEGRGAANTRTAAERVLASLPESARDTTTLLLQPSPDESVFFWGNANDWLKLGKPLSGSNQPYMHGTGMEPIGTDPRGRSSVKTDVEIDALNRGAQPPPVAGASEPTPGEARRFGAQQAQEGRVPGIRRAITGGEEGMARIPGRAEAQPAEGEAAPAAPGRLARAAAEVGGFAAAPLSLKSSLSPPFLRQGLARVLRNPVAAFRELGTSLKAAVNAEHARQVQDEINADEWVTNTKDNLSAAQKAYQEAYAKAGPVARSNMKPPTAKGAHAGRTWQDVGGQVLDWESTDPNLHPEELLYSNTVAGRAAEKLTRVSSRQAAVELNLHRTNWYKEVAQRMEDAGVTDVKAYEELRKTIEQFTQRGSWKQPGKFPLFFSTRAMSGRIQQAWRGLDAVTRGVATGQAFKPGATQEAARSFVSLIGANTAMLAGLYTAADALGLDPEIEMDGKLPTLKVGPHHYDPWAGLNTPARAAIGVITDTIDNPEGGLENAPQAAIKAVGTRGQKFLRGGVSPLVGKGLDAYLGRDYTGKKYNLAQDVKSGGFARDLVSPFIADTLIEATKEDSALAAGVIAPPAFLSAGINSYTTPEDKANEIARQTFNGRKYDTLSTPEQLQVINKLPEEHQKRIYDAKRDAYKAEREQAGWVEPEAEPEDADPTAPGALAESKAREARNKPVNEKNAQIVADNPELELQRWYFANKHGGTLKNQDAVNQALALGLPEREVKYEKLDRVLSESPKITEAWKKEGEGVRNFLDDDYLANKYAKADTPVALKNDPLYKGKTIPAYDKLPEEKQKDVLQYIRREVRKDSATLDARLAYFGYGPDSDNKRYTVHSAPASAELKRLRDTYGSEPSKKGYQFWAGY